ncbi:hypothetical protein ACSBM8_14955 [Sphingomonas sp. ASY06-1R]|uniref:hypothetical protein n=1 Tax=Sphingomonas sp. ASY06-1R TaxID=3445771 RepID=UPI003FA27D21
MSAFGLPNDFALQSSDSLRIAQALRQDRGVVCLIEASRYPASGVVMIEALRPLRHYRLAGAIRGFCRTDAAGTATIAVTLTRSSMLVLQGVIA